MDYIIRIPLLTFDIYDESEVDKHFKQVKEAIQYSSKALFQEITSNTYSELPPPLKAKIYKYLIRGKYRATPFGLWVGSGLGSFGSATQIRLGDLDYKQGQINQETTFSFLYAENRLHRKNEKYILNPALRSYSGYFTCDRFSIETEKWENIFIAEHPVITHALKYMKNHSYVNYFKFKAWFDDVSEEEIKALWDNMLHSSVFLPEMKSRSLRVRGKVFVDTYLGSPTSLDISIKSKLDQLGCEIGGLFDIYTSAYLDTFKKLFHENYDDRSVALLAIFDPMQSLGEFLDGGKIRGHSDETSLSHSALEICETREEIDLKEIYEIKPIAGAHSLTSMFKVNQDGTLLLENLVCNKPLVYLGRHDQKEAFCAYAKEIKEELYKTTDRILYADFELFEKSKFNQLTNQKCHTCYTITCISHTSGEHKINPKNLLISVYRDEVILYDRTLKRRIIPVICHPLSGQFISHPLSRLLWEIGNQNLPQFKFYKQPIYTQATYLPRLKWGDVVLQACRWKINSAAIDSIDGLKEAMIALNLPPKISAGMMDLELSLDWQNEMDLSILFQELKKVEQLEIREDLCSGMVSDSGETLYPQFIYTQVFDVKPKEKLTLRKLNPIESKADKWLYFKVDLPEDMAKYFLITSWSDVIQSLSNEVSALNWYYIHYYNPVHELRFRIDVGNDREKEDTARKIISFLVSKVKPLGISICDYYPEVRKYSRKDIQVSERLFAMESSLILQERATFYMMEKPILSMTPPEIISLMLSIWVPLVYDGILWISFKRKCLNIFRQFEKQEYVDLRNYYSENIQDKWSDLTVEETFSSSYQDVMRSHSSYHQPKIFIYLALNHVHMMCNRFFLHESRYFEDVFNYCLYREVGRKVFKKEDLKG